MHRYIKGCIIIFGLVSALTLICPNQSFALGKADELYSKGINFFKASEYKKAYDAFNQARKTYLGEKNIQKANESLEQMYKMQRIKAEYPYTRQEALKILKKTFPEQKESWLSVQLDDPKTETIKMGNAVYYFFGFAKNILFRNLDLMQKHTSEKKEKDPFFEKTKDIILKDDGSSYEARSSQPYIKPIKFFAQGSINIPRKELPKKGLYKLWIPLPIQTAAQFDIRVISVEPQEYVKFPPILDEDIGIIYMEVPLEKLKGDLKIDIKFIFSRYQERFIIDPAKVGEYNKETYLYKQYTSSYKNITITPEIKEEALKIVAGEKNPYLAAKKIYYHILEDVRYSFTPHVMLCAIEKPESVYVYENRFGDCGAQSMYFCALLRALGIPARTTGGLQLVPTLEGDHFWAEFYLPNYGWIPVDTTIAETVNYITNIPESEKNAFKNYYFANLDPYRLVIQKDVDVPLNPVPEVKVTVPAAIQDPAVVCLESETDPGFYMNENWKFKFYPVYE